jgi:putative mRNA 3-end processing factor
MLITRTSKGLYCAAGDFYIDPMQAVRRAIVTHAHTDHCRPGMGSYMTSVNGEPIVRARVGPRAVIEALPFGQPMKIGDVSVSLHPAGHILGSAQVRVEHNDEVWVVSGDYKLEPDATCETFEHVECDTFVTESTFAHPKYAWRPQEEVFNRINDWWQLNNAWERASVLYAYSLGKAQRLLAGVDDIIGPILVHNTVERFNTAYKQANIKLPQYELIDDMTIGNYKGKGALLIAPPQIKKTGILDKIGEYETAFASGWMATQGSRRSMEYDHGFALSDHADWQGLLDAVSRSKAKRVIVMHGFVQNLVSKLRREGLEAWGWP